MLKKLATIALQFSLLFVFWLILSGHYQVVYIIIGAISVGLVTFLTNDLFYSLFYRAEVEKTSVRSTLLQLWRFLAYLPWLFWRIVIANVQVAYLVLHPRLPIEPAILKFRTGLRRSVSQVMVANSITLTPGTLTVYLKDGEYIIHALVPASASDIVEAVLQNKIAAIFREKPETPPTPTWVYSFKELEP